MEEMIENGPKSNSDFQRIFNNLYVGLENNKEKKSNPLCLWEHCGSPAFENVEELFRHRKSRSERTRVYTVDSSVVPPIDRRYYCKLVARLYKSLLETETFGISFQETHWKTERLILRNTVIRSRKGDDDEPEANEVAPTSHKMVP